MKAHSTKLKANKKMKLAQWVLVSALASSSIASVPSYAYYQEQNIVNDNEEMTSDTKETIGFSSGVILGAIFGGPAGAFITGVAGNLIAKQMNSDDDIEQLTASLNKQEQENQRLTVQFNQDLSEYKSNYATELAQLEQTYQMNYQQASQIQAENLLMSLQFSTGSSDIQPHYHDQINALAQLLMQSPQLNIDLSGYTDLQGDEQLNQNLSIARVNSVKKALIDQGIAAERIQLFAYGDKQPVVANNQRKTSFYDRRVVIKLHSAQNQMASN